MLLPPSPGTSNLEHTDWPGFCTLSGATCKSSKLLCQILKKNTGGTIWSTLGKLGNQGKGSQGSSQWLAGHSARRAQRARKVIHQWRKGGRGGGGVPKPNNKCVCVAIVRWTGRLCAAGSLTPFSGSQDHRLLPGGGQQSGPLGRNFSIQPAKRSECPSGSPKINSPAAFISFYINHTCETGRQHVNS